MHQRTIECTGSVHCGIFSTRQPRRACAEIWPVSTSCTGSGHFGIFRSGGHWELARKFDRSQLAEGMVGPDVVVVAERPLQSSVHFAGGHPGGRTRTRRARRGCCARRCRYCRGGGVGGRARGMPASRRAVSNSCMNSEPPSTCTELTGRRCRTSWRKPVAMAAVALVRTLTRMLLVIGALARNCLKV